MDNVFNDFDDLEFAENSDSRCALVLVLDASDSMTQKRPGDDRTPLEALNSGLDILVTELNKDPLAKRRVEVSVIAYGTEVAEPTPFATIDNLTLPILEPMGITSTGAAVEKALDTLEERKTVYKENGIEYFKPWVMLISDGLSTDNIEEASKRIREGEDDNKLSFFAIGVEGADLDELSKLCQRGAMGLQGLKFEELFQWLSASQSAVSASNPGDKVGLPATDGWAAV